MLSFSILVPVYNRTGYIEKTLGSVCNQSYPHFEIICVDDASSDASLEILKQLEKDDVRIKIIQHQKNMGTYMTRKTAVEYAQGDYSLFLDCDDELLPNALEVLNETLEKKACDVLAFAYTDGTKVFYPFKQAEYHYEKIIAEPKIWDKTYKTEFLKKTYADTTDFYAVMAEDTYQSLVIKYFAKKYDHIDKCLLHYNIESGISHQKKSLQCFELDLQSMSNVAAAIYEFEIRKNIANKNLSEKMQENSLRYMYKHQIFDYIRFWDRKKALQLLPKYFSEQSVVPYRKKITLPLTCIELQYRFIQVTNLIKAKINGAIKTLIKIFSKNERKQ